MEKCRTEPVLGIFDIDDSLTPNLFIVDKYRDNFPKLNAALEVAEPYDWFFNSDVVSRITDFKFVTGRKTFQFDLTEKWITEKLGLCDFDLHIVGWENMERYINDKVEKFEEIIDEWRKIHGEDASIIFVEDDKHILKKIKNNYPDPCFTVIKVENGNPIEMV